MRRLLHFLMTAVGRGDRSGRMPFREMSPRAVKIGNVWWMSRDIKDASQIRHLALLPGLPTRRAAGMSFESFCRFAQMAQHLMCHRKYFPAKTVSKH